MKICDNHLQKIHEEIKKQDLNGLRIQYFKKFYKEGKRFVEINPYEEICTNILKNFVVECSLLINFSSPEKMEKLCPLCFCAEQKKELPDDWIKGATKDCKLHLKWAYHLIIQPEEKVFHFMKCPLCKSIEIGINYTKNYNFCDDCGHEWI